MKTTSDELSGENMNINKNQHKAKLIDKTFEPRNSVLTDLFETGHGKAIYNMFIIMFLFFLLDMVIKEAINIGRIRLEFETFQEAFGSNWAPYLIWGCMLLASFNVHFLFKFWARVRHRLESNLNYQGIWDKSCLSLFVIHQIIFIAVSSWAVLKFDLRPGSSMAILLEQSRMLMKVHAYIRSNALKITSQKVKNDDEVAQNLELPKFSKMLYFMFAPTLVYKDEYPRNKQIRWKEFFKSLAELFGCFFTMHFIFARVIIPKYSSFGGQIPSIAQTIYLIIHMAVPVMGLGLCLHYVVLHSCQNALSELLRFADREFYKDWWNFRTWGEYYRNWNEVVHDWLYVYVYKDMYENVTNRRKKMSQFSVFMVSALFHELTLAVSFRFFYPVMFVLFGGFGFAMMPVTKSGLDNSIMLFSWILGCSIMFNLYGIEFYARQHCPPHENVIVDFFLPRSWTC